VLALNCNAVTLLVVTLSTITVDDFYQFNRLLFHIDQEAINFAAVQLWLIFLPDQKKVPQLQLLYR